MLNCYHTFMTCEISRGRCTVLQGLHSSTSAEVHSAGLEFKYLSNSLGKELHILSLTYFPVLFIPNQLKAEAPC